MKDIEEIRKEVARRETGREGQALEYIVRPIIPEDLGLASWEWSTNKVRVHPTLDFALCGIWCQYLAVVYLRVPASANVVAIATTGQSLYEPYFWEKGRELSVDIKPVEPLPSQVPNPPPLSLCGFIIEKAGLVVA